MNKTHFIQKFILALIFIFTVNSLVYADRTANGVPGDGILGQILQSIGGGESIWVNSNTIGGSATSTFGSVTATTTNATSTFSGNVLISGNMTFANATGTTLFTTLASSTNLFATNATFSRATTTNATSTNLGVTGQTTLATTTINGNLIMGGGIVPRVVGYTASTSITINIDSTDIASTTVAHATTTFNTPSGTLYNGMMFEIWIRATTTRGLAWSTGFASSTDLALPVSVASGTTKALLEYRQDSLKWELNGLISGFAN